MLPRRPSWRHIYIALLIVSIGCVELRLSAFIFARVFCVRAAVAGLGPGVDHLDLAHAVGLGQAHPVEEGAAIVQLLLGRLFRLRLLLLHVF